MDKKPESKLNALSSLTSVAVNIAEAKLPFTLSNALVSAIYEMNLYESRLIVLGIGKINPLSLDHAKPLTIAIRASEWSQFFNVPVEKSYDEMMAAIKSLMRNPFKVSAKDHIGETHYLAMQWIDSACYAKDEGKVELILGGSIQPYLVNLAAVENSLAALNFGARLSDVCLIKN